MGASLKAEGFKNILFLVDHGGDQQGAIEAAKALSGRWKGSGVRAAYVAAYYDYDAVEKFEHDVLGVHEKSEGYHDDYYVAAISVAIDPTGVRLAERRKAHKTTINGVDLRLPRRSRMARKLSRIAPMSLWTRFASFWPIPNERPPAPLPGLLFRASAWPPHCYRECSGRAWKGSRLRGLLSTC